ncbi:hypothetical protein [Azospirillum sp.]|uniref:hypothetical protein n=1 Tax=Azospirillum sp. TaxID=34012 RepID=UPI003D7257F3
MLSRRGADVAVFRSTSRVDCKAKVRGLSANEIRSGSISTQGQYRAILSPTAFTASGAAVTLPLRTTDKILFNGAQRTITFAWPVLMGGTVVRIEVDFQG